MSRHVWPDLLGDTSRLHSDLMLFHHSVQTFKSVPFAHYKVRKTTRSPLSFRLYLVRGSHAEGVNFIAPVPCSHLPPSLLFFAHTHTPHFISTHWHTPSLIHSPLVCLLLQYQSRLSGEQTLTHSLTPGRLDYNRDHWIISLADRYTNTSFIGEIHTLSRINMGSSMSCVPQHNFRFSSKSFIRRNR